MELKDFKTFRINNKDKISVAINRHGVRFNRGACDAMGSIYGKLMFNEKTKQLVALSADSSDENSFHFFKKDSNNNGLKCSKAILKRYFSKVMQWNFEKYDYKVEGKYIAADGLLLFDFQQADIKAIR